MIKKNSRIYIAGHKGLVGSSILKKLKDLNYKNLIVRSKKQLDLTNARRVEFFFKKKKIEYLIICAAQVGGIVSNQNNPTEFFINNSLIQINLLKMALKYKLKKTIFLGSSCIYPKNSKTPIKENLLLSGYLEKTNEAYAIAKISGIKLCEFLHKQYGLDVICIMPTNVYGINDNFNKMSSHVIPGMITKFLEGKNKKTIKLFGTGKPKREFIFNDDLADAIIVSLNASKKKLYSLFKKEMPILNIGSGEEITVKKLSQMIKKISKFKGKVIFDSSYPDGVFRKSLDSSKIRSLGWKPKIYLNKGLKFVINSQLK